MRFIVSLLEIGRIVDFLYVIIELSLALTAEARASKHTSKSAFLNEAKTWLKSYVYRQHR